MKTKLSINDIRIESFNELDSQEMNVLDGGSNGGGSSYFFGAGGTFDRFVDTGASAGETIVPWVTGGVSWIVSAAGGAGATGGNAFVGFTVGAMGGAAGYEGGEHMIDFSQDKGTAWANRYHPKK